MVPAGEDRLAREELLQNQPEFQLRNSIFGFNFEGVSDGYWLSLDGAR